MTARIATASSAAAAPAAATAAIRGAAAACLVALALLFLPGIASAQTNTFTVTNMNASGSGSLAQAVASSNATSGTNTIQFAITGTSCSTSNPCRIRPTATLSITRAVTIDATTQSGYGGTPVVLLDGNDTSGTSGFTVSAGSTTIRGFIISRYGVAGIRVASGSGSTISGNFIGANPVGILVESSASSVTITGNMIGIANGYGSNGWEGNASHGIDLRGTGSTIGGTSSTTRNVIADNGGDGIRITGASNRVRGNYIGTDSNGSSARPNAGNGVSIVGATSTTIGAALNSSLSGVGNVISGNRGDGVFVSGTVTSSVIAGNFIGTNAAGSGALANGSNGIEQSGGSGLTIGGTTSGGRNVVSGNSGYGILATGSVTIQNTYVGANVAGSGTLQNGLGGIAISGTGATGSVVGDAAGLGNLVGGNRGDGIAVLAGAADVSIVGNYVGLNAAGSGSLANSGVGIRVSASSGAIIGGAVAGGGNLVGGNASHGILLTGSGTTGARIVGNVIGANAAGNGTIANSGSGIAIEAGASSNTIGGTATGEANVVRGNGGGGVTLSTTGGVPVNNRISGNSIFANTGLGIRLQNSGSTPLANNGATSTSLANLGMDTPVFTTAQLSGAYLYVTGHVGSAAGQTTFGSARVQVFRSDGDASGAGEGQTFLGALTADASGAFAGTLAVSGVNAGDRLTATATDSSGNTSEFGGNASVASATSVPLPGPTGEWRFEERGWTGAAGEVVDSTGNGYNLQSYGAATTDTANASTRSCRYGRFTGDQDRVGLDAKSAVDLAPTTAVTAMAWVYLESTPRDWMTIVSKDVTYEFHLLPDGEVLWWWGGGSRQIQTSGAKIVPGQWFHVAITYADGAQFIYVNGVPLAKGVETGALEVNGAPFLIGADVATSSTFDLMPERSFVGFIDNVRVYDRTLQQAEVEEAMKLTQPCAIQRVAGFAITTSLNGLYCLDHSVTVTPIDANGNAVSNYAGTINLSTSSGRGTWLLQSGSGAFADPVANDGAATYTFPGSQSSASFWLRYRSGAQTVNVDAVESGGALRDTNTEGSIFFSPSGFTVTSTPITAPVTSIPAFTGSITAGTNQPVYLTAFGQTPTDATCGVIDGYVGTKALKFWLTRSDPATGTVSATVNATTIANAEGSSVAQNVTFTSGQATVTFKYKDVGRIALSMKDDTTGNASLPTGIRGSTGNFVSRPANFTVSNVRRTSDGAANPGTTTAGGTVFLAAGRPFSATVTAIDAEGSTTPNYGRESTPESVRFTTSLVLPATGSAPAVTGSFGTFSSGVASGTAFAWNEVGTMRLVPRVSDGDYLASGDVVGSASTPVGRFVPDRFTVATNTPVFQTACIAGGYGYVGQPFTYAVAPVITATAVAFGGSTTTNYTGSLFRLTNSTVAARTYSGGAQTLDTSGLPATSADPTIVDAGGGVATLTYSAGTGLAFARTTPVAPFTATISLTTTVTDADGVTAGSATTFGASGGIAFSTGATQRYGRLVVRSAAGSELLDLPVPTGVQYWLDASRGFTSTADDSCTTAPAIVLKNYTRSLAAGETCVRDTGSPGVSGAGCAAASIVAKRFRATASAGDFNLQLAAPGAGNSGSVTVEATAPAWLRYDWNVATPGFESPSGLATFGVFQGPSSRIYQREVY